MVFTKFLAYKLDKKTFDGQCSPFYHSFLLVVVACPQC